MFLFLVQPRAGLPVAGVPHPELARGGRLLLEADARGAQGRGGDAAQSAALEAAPHEGKAEAGAAQKWRPLRQRFDARRDRRGAGPLRHEEAPRRHRKPRGRRQWRYRGHGIGNVEWGKGIDESLRFYRKEDTFRQEEICRSQFS